LRSEPLENQRGKDVVNENLFQGGEKSGEKNVLAPKGKFTGEKKTKASRAIVGGMTKKEGVRADNKCVQQKKTQWGARPKSGEDQRGIQFGREERPLSEGRNPFLPLETSGRG